MLEAVISNIESKNLFSRMDQLLVAVSGGVDSMVLLHFLHSKGFSVQAVHCNFQLRYPDAETEFNLVKSFCEEKEIPFQYAEFNTKQFANEKRISIQMAARDLRYNWFNELLNRKEGKYILTAHHLQDQTETFFINLLRGSGLNGLKGIPEKNRQIIRPFLLTDKKIILEYATFYNVPFLNDKSNSERKYLRNKIRLDLLPLLRSLNNSFDKTLQAEMKVIAEANAFINLQFEEISKKCCCMENDVLKIEKSFFASCTFATLLLHYILSPHGFNSSQITDILNSAHSISGKLFHSDTHTLASDRNHWVVSHLYQENIDELIVMDSPIKVLNKTFSIELKDGPVYMNEKNKVAFDANLIKFPLRVTLWQPGDRFFPLGMKGSKKLSDYFVAQKMNFFQKRNQLLIKSVNDIVWVVQKRSDSRFAVNSATKCSLIISISDEG